MTVLPAVAILAAVCLYLACEHRLREAVTVQDGRDRDALAHARDRVWFWALPPDRFQALGERVLLSFPEAVALTMGPAGPWTAGAALDEEVLASLTTARTVTLTGVLSPFAAALLAGTVPPTRWQRLRVGARRWRWRVGDWWERVVTDALDGGSIRW